MTWAEIDWAALERLRGLFLSGEAAQGAYWQSATDLASYDLTYGERIGWKWDAVLRELDQRGWQPPDAARSGIASGAAPVRNKKLAVLDWGCGSGVAGRRVVNWLGADQVGVLRLWDYSALAADFSAQAARVVRLLTDEDLHYRMRKAGRWNASERFCSDKIIPQYEKYYRDVLNASK